MLTMIFSNKSMIFHLFCMLASIWYIYAKIDRNPVNGEFSGQFSVINYGRMYQHTVLMYLEDLDYQQCIFYCMSHLNCVTVSYSAIARLCELNDMEFNDIEADVTAYGWINYGTPAKINGGYSQWKSTGPCSTSCDGGIMSYYRTCDNPKPAFGGDPCQGHETKTESCNTNPCLICYDAKNTKNGKIIVPESGILKEILLTHISGEVWCTSYCRSIWGCCKENMFRTVVKDSNQNLIYPLELNGYLAYKVHDQDPMGNLFRISITQKVYVVQGDRIFISYSDSYFKDNKGSICVNVKLIFA